MQFGVEYIGSFGLRAECGTHDGDGGGGGDGSGQVPQRQPMLELSEHLASVS